MNDSSCLYDVCHSLHADPRRDISDIMASSQSIT